jgi:integrative and conjugative element protein (TIGR02256 family)
MERVLLSKTAVENFLTAVSEVSNRETGGVLCGYYGADNILFVESASGPGPKAHHMIAEFILDKEHMDQYLDFHYAESLGKHIYVGEWHTHPQRYPMPSDQDLVSIYERTLEWEYGEIIFIIIGFIDLTVKSFESQAIGIFFSRDDQKFYRVRIELIGY